MSDCLFCRIAQKELPTPLLYSDEQVVVFKDIHPKAPIHLLVVPHKHIERLDKLTEADFPIFNHMIKLLPGLAREQGLPDGFRTVINTGKGGGQEIFHLHIHLLGYPI